MSCHNPNNQPIDSKHFCYHINMTEQPVTVQPYIDKVAKAEALARITATLAPFQRRVERRPGFPKTEEAHAINAARPQQTKIENVIQLLEKRTEKLTPIIKNQRKAAEQAPARLEQAEAGLRQVEQTIVNLERQKKQAEKTNNIVAGLAARLPDKAVHALGKRTNVERETAIQEVQRALKRAQQTLSAAQAALTNVQKAIEAVTFYSPGYLTKQANEKRNQELIAANQKGGPLITTERMTLSLKRPEEQLRLRDKLVAMGFPENDETGNPLPTLPVEVWQAMLNYKHEKEPGYDDERSFLWGNGITTSEALKVPATAYEVAAKYAKEHNLKIDNELFALFFSEALKMPMGIHPDDEVNFKKDHNLTHKSSLGWYAIWGGQAERLF